MDDSNNSNNPKQKIVESLKQANNILVTVKKSPSIDQLSACIGLTLILNEQGKHGTAVFSGEVPSVLEFLEPGKTLERDTNSLQDFIISLDKGKADKLRYKVEDSVVRIFITPFRTSISEKDLEFGQGDFNVDVVVALGVHNQDDLDTAITSHGRILHDATVISMNIEPGDGEDLGSINWLDSERSSLSEMVADMADSLGKEDSKAPVIDNQIATALLTGIVAETERFGNGKTTPATMEIAAKLLTAGANQELVATKLAEPAKEKPQENNDNIGNNGGNDNHSDNNNSSDEHSENSDDKPDEAFEGTPMPTMIQSDDEHSEEHGENDEHDEESHELSDGSLDINHPGESSDDTDHKDESEGLIELTTKPNAEDTDKAKEDEGAKEAEGQDDLAHNSQPLAHGVEGEGVNSTSMMAEATDTPNSSDLAKPEEPAEAKEESKDEAKAEADAEAAPMMAMLDPSAVAEPNEPVEAKPTEVIEPTKAVEPTPVAESAEPATEAATPETAEAAPSAEHAVIQPLRHGGFLAAPSSLSSPSGADADANKSMTTVAGLDETKFALTPPTMGGTLNSGGGDTDAVAPDNNAPILTHSAPNGSEATPAAVAEPQAAPEKPEGLVAPAFDIHANTEPAPAADPALASIENDMHSPHEPDPNERLTAMPTMMPPEPAPAAPVSPAQVTPANAGLPTNLAGGALISPLAPPLTPPPIGPAVG